MGYSLRVNHKKLAGASHPRRDDQFRHITELRERCAADNVPVISVDTKKKELVGTFRNPGAKWVRRPERVNDHDFRSDAEGLAIPYGIYDPRANAGTVFVGQTADTPAFGRRLHREMVAHRGLQALSRRRRLADPRRRRRQQQLHGARLEVQPATPPRQPARPARECGPLPVGHLEVESHRTPPVLRGHQELGRPPAGQFRNHPQIPAHHAHRHRPAVRAHLVRKTYQTASRSPTRKCRSYASHPTTPCPNGTTPSNRCNEIGTYSCAGPK